MESTYEEGERGHRAAWSGVDTAQSREGISVLPGRATWLERVLFQKRRRSGCVGDLAWHHLGQITDVQSFFDLIAEANLSLVDLESVATKEV
jgi:hypothetical protein